MFSIMVCSFIYNSREWNTSGTEFFFGFPPSVKAAFIVFCSALLCLVLSMGRCGLSIPSYDAN